MRLLDKEPPLGFGFGGTVREGRIGVHVATKLKYGHEDDTELLEEVYIGLLVPSCPYMWSLSGADRHAPKRQGVLAEEAVS